MTTNTCFARTTPSPIGGKLFARYSFSNVDTFTPSAIPDSPDRLDDGAKCSAGTTYISDPRCSSMFHLGYNRENAINSSQQIGVGILPSLASLRGGDHR